MNKPTVFFLLLITTSSIFFNYEASNHIIIGILGMGFTLGTLACLTKLVFE